MKHCLLLMSILLIARPISLNACTCSQIDEEMVCTKSTKCTWDDSRCRINPNFASSNSKEFNCSNFPQEECRLLKECYFIKGECQQSSSCQSLSKNSCDQSSNFCVSDGRKCIDVAECSSYLTQIACQSKSLENKYCFWDKKICRSIEECQELPKSLKNDEECRAQIPHCTVGIEGGCIESPQSCNQHVIQSQCYTNYNQKIQCFWDVNNKCLERLCKNAKYGTQVECKKILNNCTTDGIWCIDLSDCYQYKTQEGCQYDKAGNACAFVKQQCFPKSCATAPETYTLLEQCNQYLNEIQCAPLRNGGCKDFPKNCQEFETFDSCLKLNNGTECYWTVNQQCKTKECSDAPQEYNYQNCPGWMANCIGQISGSCTERPVQCGEIHDPQSCDHDRNDQRCFFDPTDNQCKNLICSNLKFPQYSSHSQCQEKLSSCTFSSIAKGCFEFECASIIDPHGCDKDSSGFPCILNGCITKTCSNAPSSLEDHTKCEEWNSNCTLNINGNACEYKHNNCSEYIESQCYNTKNGDKCIWRVNQCQDLLCTDAPQSYSSHELCRSEWKTIAGECTLAYSGQGCQRWPQNCTEITQNNLCLIGTANGELCSWFNSSCQRKDCSNAPDIYKTTSQCSKWLSNCTFDNSICVDQSTIQCNSMNSFTSHSECYGWNTNCTIAPRILEQGCEVKRLCSEYKQESQCKIGSDGFCQWDVANQSCIKFCSSIVSKDYSRESCESFNDICTIGQIHYSCVSKGSSCSNMVIKQECLTTSDGKLCVWNSTQNVCTQSQCSQNTTAITEQECLGYQMKGYCQLKINSDGTYGIGCELRNTSCSGIGQQKCNKTYLQNGHKCLFYNGSCYDKYIYDQNYNYYDQNYCSSATAATTNEECQQFYSRCQLNPSGTGCVDIQSCYYIASNVCNQVEVTNHLTCHYEAVYGCEYNYNYSYFHYESTCINGHDYHKWKLKWISGYCQLRQCYDAVTSPNDQNCQEYQSFCRYNGSTGCIANTTCSNVTYKELCDKATDSSGKFCAWDPANSICLSNDLCENQKTATGTNKDRICYDWQSNGSFLQCFANPIGDGCIQMSSCDQIKIFIQCKSVSKCYWVQGLKCQDSPMCHANATAISKFECQIYNPYCDLNWNALKGCAYTTCSQVPASQCDLIVLNNGSYCYLNGSQQCLSFSCSNLTSQSSCTAVRNNGSKCYWNGSQCITYPCDQIPDVLTNDDCIAYNITCQVKLTITSSSQCRDKMCTDYTSQSSCQVDTAGTICYWNGISCDIALGLCSDYMDNIICDYSKQLDGVQCKYDNDTPTCIGLQHTCNNYDGTTFSLEQCQDWLSSCTINPLADACIDKVDCKQAPTTYTTHSECQSYLSQCTVARNQPTCVSLPLNCQEATDIQCYLDTQGNKCYWSDKLNECTKLSSCDLINLNITTHQDCISLLGSCTVNSNLHGCVSLQNCADYSQEQCYISHDDIVCVWFDTQCQNKSCTTASLVDYTNIGCRTQFDSTCSLNELGTQCIESPKTCSEYNQFQCSALNSQNFYGTPCIITLLGECIERTCENSSLILKTISLDNCNILSPTCLLDLCRKQVCTDILSSSEEVCQKILPKEPKCTSSPLSCVERAACSASLSFFTCNFNDKGQQCQWVNDKCILKTCQSAPITLKSSKKCEAYLGGCIARRLGGCMERTSCPQIEVEEECKIDNSNIECNWNFDQQSCQYQECQPLCGDGIIAKGFEECDDGNSLPYDGCYKCQFDCCLGCNECVEGKCQQCEQGWRLLGEKCETSCGDGYTKGKEECDDMNDIPNDGCFKCQFQCDLHCQQCDQGICDECQYGWKLYDQQCRSTCGDGLLVPDFEQCDDANTSDGDGCSSQCYVEDGWLCSQNKYKITDCLFGNVPKIELTTTKVGKNSEVLVSFNQELQFKDQVYNDRQPKEFISAFIQNVGDQTFQININQETSYKIGQLNALYFTIQIQFLEQMNEAILKVQIQDVLENQYKQGLSSLTATIRLQPPQLLSKSAKSVAAGAAQFNMIIIYSLVSLSVIGILLGNMDIFWNLLEQLQFLSYLRYINVEYPEHLNIFLEIFSVISIKPILDFIHFETAMKFIHFGEIPYIKSVGKFKDDNINSYFIENIASTIVAYIMAFMGYYICRLVIRLFDPIRIDCKIGLYLISFKGIDQIKWRTRILRLSRFILKSCFRTVNYFFYSEIIRIYISSSYDILLSLMLQISKPQYDVLKLQISYYLALVTLLSTFAIILVFYTTISSPYPKRRIFLPIFENLKRKNIYARHYHTYQLIKKTLFISALVLLQEIPIIQNLLISMLSMVNLIYLYQFRPLEDSYEMIKLILIEFSVTVNTLGLSISIVFFSNSVLQAWLNIGIYGAALCISLGLDIIKYIKRIYQAYVDRNTALQASSGKI